MAENINAPPKMLLEASNDFSTLFKLLQAEEVQHILKVKFPCSMEDSNQTVFQKVLANMVRLSSTLEDKGAEQLMKNTTEKLAVDLKSVVAMFRMSTKAISPSTEPSNHVKSAFIELKTCHKFHDYNKLAKKVGTNYVTQLKEACSQIVEEVSKTEEALRRLRKRSTGEEQSSISEIIAKQFDFDIKYVENESENF